MCSTSLAKQTMAVWVTGATTHPVLGRTGSPCDVLVAPGVPCLPTRLLPRAVLSSSLRLNTTPSSLFSSSSFPSEKTACFHFLIPRNIVSLVASLRSVFQRLSRRTLSHEEGAPQTQLKDRKVEKHFKCHSPLPSFFSLKLSLPVPASGIPCSIMDTRNSQLYLWLSGDRPTGFSALEG